ncbi:MAG: hypothetical protein C5B53_08750 [Candidatus Melainabacteria bacterium]|nr:MAG: hypothetical protein C5B53_08750 [Candidatus Melainabacteria bacterium]
MERLKRMGTLVRSPKSAVWAGAYVLLLGLKPWALDKIQKLVALAPLDCILVALVLAGIYVLLLPAKKKSQFKDIWDGGKARVQAREAITALKQAIDKCAAGHPEVVMAARMAFCMAMLSFQGADYEEALRTAVDAQQTLVTPP